MLDKITDSMQFIGETLKLRARRQEVLTSNITNADTPNYKAVDFKFADALRAASGEKMSEEGTALLMTNKKHFPNGGAGLSTAELLMYRRGNNASIDGNTVDIDKERAAFSENSVKYEAALKGINGRIATLKQAMGSQ